MDSYRVRSMLRVCEWGDGILPKYSQESMVRLICMLNDEEFKKLVAELDELVKLAESVNSIKRVRA